MHGLARRLADDENACMFADLDDRARAERKLGLASAALAYFVQQQSE